MYKSLLLLYSHIHNCIPRAGRGLSFFFAQFDENNNPKTTGIKHLLALDTNL